MSNEKVNEALANGKAGAQAAYAKGNELMDKVGFLKNPTYKKIVWGVLCLVVLLVVGRIFGCGGTQTPFDVVKETMVAIPDGDLETVFSHMYIPSEERERLSKLSAAEVELFEKQIVESFVRGLGDVSAEELAVMKSVFETIQHKGTKVEGDKAVVTYSLTACGEEKEETVELRKVDGEWKIKF